MTLIQKRIDALDSPLAPRGHVGRPSSKGHTSNVLDFIWHPQCLQPISSRVFRFHLEVSTLLIWKADNRGSQAGHDYADWSSSSERLRQRAKSTPCPSPGPHYHRTRQHWPTPRTHLATRALVPTPGPWRPPRCAVSCHGGTCCRGQM